jgi:cold shock CspA family protein
MKMKGTIITWNGERYFGFVQSLEFKDGLFFHGSSVLEPPGTELAKGIAVEFQTDHDRTGRPRAINVRVVGQVSSEETRPAALDRDRHRHREFRDRRDERQRYETAVMTPRERAERLWTHGGADEV